MSKRIWKHDLVGAFKEIVNKVEVENIDLEQAFNEVYINSEEKRANAARVVAEKLSIKLGPDNNRKIRDYILVDSKKTEFLSESKAAKEFGYHKTVEFYRLVVLKGLIFPLVQPGTNRRLYYKEEVENLREDYRLALID